MATAALVATWWPLIDMAAIGLGATLIYKALTYSAGAPTNVQIPDHYQGFGDDQLTFNPESMQGGGSLANVAVTKVNPELYQLHINNAVFEEGLGQLQEIQRGIPAPQFLKGD